LFFWGKFVWSSTVVITGMDPKMREDREDVANAACLTLNPKKPAALSLGLGLSQGRLPLPLEE